jgi:hypothetical protein
VRGMSDRLGKDAENVKSIGQVICSGYLALYWRHQKNEIFVRYFRQIYVF